MATPAGGKAYEYVVVGSGAGGGTVAARLAEAGMRVLLLEAGDDPCALKPGEPGLPEEYRVPAFHTFASENEAMSWNFFVRDFEDDAQRRRPYENPPRGVLYPRAATLGGCTAHNAMILIYPHDTDWDHIAALTEDQSWSAKSMRRYFRRLENCRHRPLWRAISAMTFGLVNPTGHGWSGWLDTEVPVPTQAFEDRRMMRMLRNSVRAALTIEAGGEAGPLAMMSRVFRALRRSVAGENDPNDNRLQGRLGAGLCLIPLSTKAHQRTGSRERILSAAERHRLDIEYQALASKVLFDDERRAVGVEYLKGANLYRASPRSNGADGESRKVFVEREVILSGGAFNTPQLLMLSGIGPSEHLAMHGIEVRVDLPGVGRNLQDRYEVELVHKAKEDWRCLEGAKFEKEDAAYAKWLQGRGMYISNGAAVAFTLHSKESRPDPDLFVMGLLTRFSGYFPGYSKDIRNSRGDLTFAILKAHTNNRAGVVELKSNDPRDPPLIDFRYFDSGDDAADEDLEAVVEGIRRVRRITMKLQSDRIIGEEEIPGPLAQSTDELKDFVRRNAWGHHASCSCAIGPRESGGVLDSDFRVYGVSGLRVVDASVFPRIPGFFIVSAIYMIGEKAANVILADSALSVPKIKSEHSDDEARREWRAI